MRECSQLDQRRRQEYAVANSLLLQKSSIIRKKKVFVNILSLFYRTFSFVEYFVIVLQFEYILKTCYLPRDSCQLMLPQKIAKQKPYPQHSCISLFQLVRLFLSKTEKEKINPYGSF
jgi:hypothetical protein